MKNYYLLLVVVVFALSCSKDEEIPLVFTDRIILEDPKISESAVVLKWSELASEEFSYYMVVRNERRNPGVSEYWQEHVIATIYDRAQTTFTDTDAPYSPFLEYTVVGVLSSYMSQAQIRSNSKEILREEIKVLDMPLHQVIPDIKEKKLYLFSPSGAIQIYDYQSQTRLASMNVNAKTGYSSIGIHNGQRELYVPRNDGWIYIYDANTLEQIDRMDIGRSSSCVIYNEGLLFVSTDAWTQNPLKVYNRSTKKMIWETGDFDLTRFHLIPGTNSEFIEITLNIGPTDADYYNFDAHGTLIDHQDDRYHGDFPLDANIFAFFPDQEKFITSREGAVYGLDMQFQSRLPRGFLEFSSFSFSDDGRVIYAGCSNERSVQRYDAQDYARSGFYETKTYPEYIFTDGDELIIIGKASNSADSLLSIEKIEL